MFGESHDIPHEFPEYQTDIHALCQENEKFNQLYQEYHAVEKEIQEIEHNIEPVSDAYAENLKMQRVHLKDQIYQALRQHHNG